MKFAPPELCSLWRSQVDLLTVLLESLWPPRIVVVERAAALRIGGVVCDVARCGDALQTCPGKILVDYQGPSVDVALLSGAPWPVGRKRIVAERVVVAGERSVIGRERSWLDRLIQAIVVVVPIVVKRQQHRSALRGCPQSLCTDSVLLAKIHVLSRRQIAAPTQILLA